MNTFMNDKFRYEYFSDNEYEFLALEVLYKDQWIYELNKESGIDHIEITFFKMAYRQDGKVELKVRLDDFIDALNKAEQYLIEA